MFKKIIFFILLEKSLEDCIIGSINCPKIIYCHKNDNVLLENNSKNFTINKWYLSPSNSYYQYGLNISTLNKFKYFKENGNLLIYFIQDNYEGYFFSNNLVYKNNSLDIENYYYKVVILKDVKFNPYENLIYILASIIIVIFLILFYIESVKFFGKYYIFNDIYPNLLFFRY